LVDVGTSGTNAIGGLCCFDFEAETQRWHYLTGPYLQHPTPVDLDGDGRKEIVVGSSASDHGNGGEDGTDDRESNLYAFTAEGQLLWRRPLEKAFTAVYPLVVDLDGDGRPELLLVAWEGKVKSVTNQGNMAGPANLVETYGRLLVVLDSQLKVRGQLRVAGTFPGKIHVVWLQVADLDRDGQKEILWLSDEALVVKLAPVGR
jgi:hypothetical protein